MIAKLLLVLGISLSLGLGACTGYKSRKADQDARIAEHNKTAAPGDKIKCHYETRIGSNRKHRVCRTVKDSKIVREKAQDDVMKLRLRGANQRTGD